MIWQFIACRCNSRSGVISFTSTRETSIFMLAPFECLPALMRRVRQTGGRISQLIVVVRLSPTLTAANPDEAQLLQHPVGSQVQGVGACFDAGESQFFEPKLDEGAAGLGRQSSSPIRTGQI